MKVPALILFMLASAGAQIASQSAASSTATPTQQEEPVEKLKARIQRMNRQLMDWPELARYAAANREIGAPKKGERRIVFYGDSITDVWKLDQSFPGKSGYINRGISGQTTPQMLVRFTPDVVDLKPTAVVILAGTNDIAGNTGPMTVEQIEENYAAMATLARANGIHVYSCSVLPVHGYTEKSKVFFPTRDPQKILALNAWLKSNAKKYGYTYVDYFSQMVDDAGLLRKELADDGLHPNAAGYAIMTRVLNQAMAQKTNAAKKE